MTGSRLPLTSRYPLLYPLRVRQRQAARWLRWHFGSEDFATTLQPDPLPHKVYRHQSRLRRLHSDDPQEALWQDNKVRNHRLALPHLDGIVILPGQTFSFWRLVGRPTAARGFAEGMELSQGRARGGTGGGLCQIGNLLHWLALHSPLQVTQRASHSFDPFPDQGRVIPYGTGAALFWNYIDLWLYNPTDRPFQLRLWLTDTLLNGEIRSDAALPHRYRIVERNAGFAQADGQWLRHNEIWRETILKGQDARVVLTERLYANRVRVMYPPEGA
jgi:vancomycin resistance protein VanW